MLTSLHHGKLAFASSAHPGDPEREVRFPMLARTTRINLVDCPPELEAFTTQRPVLVEDPQHSARRVPPAGARDRDQRLRRRAGRARRRADARAAARRPLRLARRSTSSTVELVSRLRDRARRRRCAASHVPAGGGLADGFAEVVRHARGGARRLGLGAAGRRAVAS